MKLVIKVNLANINLLGINICLKTNLSVIPVDVVIPGLSGGRDISRQGEVA